MVQIFYFFFAHVAQTSPWFKQSRDCHMQVDVSTLATANMLTAQILSNIIFNTKEME